MNETERKVLVFCAMVCKSNVEEQIDGLKRYLDSLAGNLGRQVDPKFKDMLRAVSDDVHVLENIVAGAILAIDKLVRDMTGEKSAESADVGALFVPESKTSDESSTPDVVLPGQLGQ